MKNLDQIRATAAVQLTDQRNSFTRNEIAKFPGMVMTNGLLAATAFVIESDREAREGIARAVHGMAQHLANPALGITVLSGVTNANGLLRALSEKATSLDLQRATREALAFFSYLKRFAPPGND